LTWIQSRLASKMATSEGRKPLVTVGKNPARRFGW
jgi:hypothetical protein